MKKILLFLVCVLGAITNYASAESPLTTSNLDFTFKEITHVKFVLDLGIISEATLESGTTAIDDLFQLEEQESKLECSITLKGKLGIGGTGVEVEVTVSGPCDEVKEKAKEMLRELSEIGRKV